MRNVAPQVTAPPVVIAEEQEEYKTVVAVPVDHPDYAEVPGKKNSLLLAFRPSREELEAFNRGELLYLHLLTFGRPMTPVILTVGTDGLHELYGLTVERPSAGPCKKRRLSATGGVQECTGEKGHDVCGPWEDVPRDLWREHGGRA